MHLTPEDVLHGLADRTSQVFELLAKHDALWRAQASMQLVVLASEILTWIQDVIGYFQAEV